MKLLIGLMAILCPVGSFCQLSSADYQPLNIGDVVPDIEIDNIINYKTVKARLRDLNNKLVILDFFGTWCGACVGSLRRLDSLQKQFGDDIAILVVAYEPKSTIEAFLKTHRMARNIGLPFVTGDSTLKKMFPHRLLPHEVWINKGVVKALTEPYYVNAANIQALLSGREVKLRLKKDVIVFDRNKPLLEDNNAGTTDQLLYKTLLTKYLDGVGVMAGSSTDTGSSTKRIYYINLPLLSIYMDEMNQAFTNKLLLEVKDKARYLQGEEQWDTWAPDNAYCYEVTVPVNMNKAAIALQKTEDLNRYFNIESCIEKRVVKCLSLIVTNPLLLPRTKEGKPQLLVKGNERPVTLLQNQPLLKLVTAINKRITGIPYTTLLIDETNYNSNVDIELKSDLNNIAALNKELQQYGLKLQEVEREMEMMVVREKGMTGGR